MEADIRCVAHELALCGQSGRRMNAGFRKATAKVTKMLSTLSDDRNVGHLGGLFRDGTRVVAVEGEEKAQFSCPSLHLSHSTSS